MAEQMVDFISPTTKRLRCPVQNIQIYRSIFPGPFNPDAERPGHVGFEQLGELQISYQKFELSFEMKIDKLESKARTRISDRYRHCWPLVCHRKMQAH